MTRTGEEIETDERPRLDDPAVVDRLVRRFTAHALDILAPPRHPDFMGAIDFECLRMNNLFLTGTPNDDFQRGPWNTPDQLGMYIRGAIMIDGDIRFGVRDAFMQHLDRVVDLVGKHPTEMELLIEQLTRALLGTAHESPTRI
jgi:hypothetical protein